MRVQHAHYREETSFDLFGLPKLVWGVGPRRALQFCSSSWFGQAKKAVAEKQAAEEPEKVPSSAPHPDRPRADHARNHSTAV
jgi:hypothetical protein